MSKFAYDLLGALESFCNKTGFDSTLKSDLSPVIVL